MGLIIIGSILIVLQLFSDVGSLIQGGLSYLENMRIENITSFAVFTYDLLGFVAYSFIGILGVFLLIGGVKSYSKKENDNQNEETSSSDDNETEEIPTPADETESLGEDL